MRNLQKTLLLWEGLVENGYAGEEFTLLQEVVEQLKAFMVENQSITRLYYVG